MEGFIGILKELSPIVTMLGVGITIFLLGWRIPSRREVNRIADNLHARMDKEMSNLQTRIDREVSDLQTRIDKEVSNLHMKIEKESADLHMKIEQESSHLQRQIEQESSHLQRQVDKALETTLAITKEIREDMRMMQSQMVRLGERIEANSRAIEALSKAVEANSQAIHVDINNLAAKVEVMSNTLQAEIQSRGDQKPH